MPDTAAGFVDAAFLEKEGVKALGVTKRDRKTDAGAVVAWLRKSYSRHSFEASEQYAWGNQAPAWVGSKLLRTYWYDGAFAPGHPKAAPSIATFKWWRGPPGSNSGWDTSPFGNRGLGAQSAGPWPMLPARWE